MARPLADISRRDVLVAVPVTVAAAVIGSQAAATRLPADGAAVTMLRAGEVSQHGSAAETSYENILRLTAELSTALQRHDGGRWFATVFPADHQEQPVSIARIQAAIDAALDVSPGLMEAITAHCVAYNDLARASRDADAVALRREPDAGAFARLDEASAKERALFMALCRHRTRNDVERHDKASYLLTFCEDGELEQDCVAAVLQAMIVSPDDALPGFNLRTRA